MRYEEGLDYPSVGPRWVSAIYTPTYDGDTVPTGWIAVILDIDQRKRAEEALPRPTGARTSSWPPWPTSCATRWPPSATPCRSCAEPTGDPRPQTAREMMDRQVGHMVRLVDDLLDVSRITRGKIELRREPVDLAAVVGRAVETSRPLIERRRHGLSVTLPAEPLRWSRPGPAGAGGRQPAQQRRQVHRRGRPHLADGRARGRREAVVRVRGHRRRHRPPEMLPQVFDLFTQVGPRAGPVRRAGWASA